ncbi:Uncharacterized protein DBV15_10842 [Temnothorax longispinosus]|uniref:Uncharacterized protein n=1 Tax=Temnothorax longispinosus TaxID=300112 RepID=A0A4S2KM02_9HYME|nr:Uncharacterized protein DBV15_10842 [Temnothorax longispinosus]
MRSGHSVPCRYSPRAARDTKHWPQAKTNYNGLHSPRNAFYPWPSPLRVVRGRRHHAARARYRRHRCGPRSVLLTMRIDSCLISFALSREVPASLLGETRSASNRIKKIRGGRTVREGERRSGREEDQEEATRNKGLCDSSGRN